MVEQGMIVVVETKKIINLGGPAEADTNRREPTPDIKRRA